MIYGLWQSAGGLQAQEYRQAIIAQNLANTDTPGYRADRVAFVERLNASQARGSARGRNPVLDGMTGGVMESELYTDFSCRDSALISSDNSLDVAVAGNGFLSVRTPEGIRYTRDGRLTLDRSGTLVQANSGAPVVDAQGQTIALDPQNVKAIKIDGTGVVRQGDNVAGRLNLVDFADRQALDKVGQNQYAAGQAQPIAATGTVRQFAYEGSNVDPAQTLVEMISAARAYEMNARMISMQDETLGRAVTEVGRTT
jgi:flagellar basal-body rod protein FlgF